MITVHKGNAINSETFRLILTCDQCHFHTETDVPLHNIRDNGDAATEPYLDRARVELAKACPHMQEELAQQGKDASASSQGFPAPAQRRDSHNGRA